MAVRVYKAALKDKKKQCCKTKL